MRRITLIIFFSILVGCNTDNSNKKSICECKQSINQQPSNQNLLKKAILYNGDIKAYKSLDIEYLDYAYTEEFLLYAMIMANKFDYPQAYYDVFTCLTDVYLSDFHRIDDKTASLAIDYLLKAYERGHKQAKEIVIEFNIKRNENSKQQIERIFKK
jgi:hypothetical protein